MKLKLFGLFLFSALLPLIGFSYQNQGFDSYTENGNSISFSCTKQCVLILGEKSNNDIIKISGLLGNGDVIAGVMGANQFYPITNQKAANSLQFFISSLNGQAIPNNAPVALVFQGSVSSASASILFSQSNLIDNIEQIRKDFWSNEPMTFYSINLRYGTKILGTPLIQIGYRLFFLGLIILYIKNKLNTKTISYLAIGIFLVIALKNLITNISITSQGLEEYTFASPGSKTYMNLGDYYEFMAQARKSMKIDDQRMHSCKVYLECGQEWPYCVHADYIFTKPCESTKDITKADYALFYQKAPAQTAGMKTILEKNGSFVLAK